MDTLVSKTLSYLKKKKRILFLTTSNRWSGADDIPKSTQLARAIASKLNNVKIIDVPSLKIYPCEGNVSDKNGNNCGVRDAVLTDKQKNPSGYHRCWASYNNKDDDLWKISKELFNSDCIVFFTSVRWGQANSFYQKLIERLTWIENCHSSLKENSIVKNISAGIIVIGHNWRGESIVDVQKAVLNYFGFNVVNSLCWNWDFTTPDDESLESYSNAVKEFKKRFITK